jgi:hypothetical protein
VILHQLGRRQADVGGTNRPGTERHNPIGPRNPGKGFPGDCLFAELFTLPSAESSRTDGRDRTAIDRGMPR